MNTAASSNTEHSRPNAKNPFGLPTVWPNNARSTSVPFANIPWENRFLEHFPVDPEKRNFTRQVRGILASEVQPTPVRAPQLLGWSEALASTLGLECPTPESPSLNMLAGNFVKPTMRPYAARYGGHQFGNWAGQLGDGRAITLGEMSVGEMSVAGATAGSSSRASLVEFQLKGAGLTPYSRTADGRAVLRSSLREFLCSEAMHFLGVPTTRALSLVATGDTVVRDIFYNGNARPEPGAIVCRVAPSFLRFGHFEILAAHKETDLLKQLALWLLEDHYPEVSAAVSESAAGQTHTVATRAEAQAEAFGLLLDAIAKRTALLMAEWMRVGFVHGVMNTDNMSALGLTIDYGPYGWLEPYEPRWTPNTTDAAGRRYCFGAQPQVALWNVARLAEAFLPLLPEKQQETRAQQSLNVYMQTFGNAYDDVLARKLGISKIEGEHDEALVQDLLELLEISRADMTLFFRALCTWTHTTEVSSQVFLSHFEHTFYNNALHAKQSEAGWLAWFSRYNTRVQHSFGKTSAWTTAEQRQQHMEATNPKYVLRNFLAHGAIEAAEQGNTAPLERLLRVLANPYSEQPDAQDLAQKRPEWAENKPGCSALSCSS